jgi:biotin carboxyl carrier protein
MKFMVEIDGQERLVQIETRDGRPVFSIDGRKIEAEAGELERGVYSVLLDGRSFEIKIEEGADRLTVHVSGRPYPYRAVVRDQRRVPRSASAFSAAGRQELASPMPGKVVRLLVEENQEVEAGQGVVVVEAMKMQNEIRSPKRGRVVRVFAQAGAAVHAGQPLLVIE